MANTPREQIAEYVAALADGEDVWCGWANQPARTADGFCQFCGSTRHGEEDIPRLAGPVSPQALWRAMRARRTEWRVRMSGTDSSWDEV